jgi:hypothetical protein
MTIINPKTITKAVATATANLNPSTNPDSYREENFKNRELI